MSIQLMAVAFKTRLQPTQKLVLLALCDCANDTGECFPSAAHLADKTGLSDRSVRRVLAEFERAKMLRRFERAGRSCVYQLMPDFWPKSDKNTRSSIAPTPDTLSPPPLTQCHTTPDTLSPPPLTQCHTTPDTLSPITINEPSIEPSLNRKRERTDKNSAKEKKASHVLPCPDGVNGQTWADWLELRRAKKAPVTATVLDGARREAAAAGYTLDAFLREWCERGSQGLKAEWLHKPLARAVQQHKYAGAAQAIFGKQGNFNNRGEVIDV